VLTQLANRYGAVLAGLVAIALVVVLLPDRAASLSAPSSATTGQAGSGGGSAAGGSAATAGPSAAPSGAAGGTGGKGRGGSGSGSSAASPTPTPGVSVTGVKCGPGVRQFTWSPYSPPCVPQFAGNNGGATSHGVTGSTITLVLRNPTDWDTTAQGGGAPTFAQIAHDEGVLANYFNTQYELYGRKVVITQFNGQGSFLAEGANQDQSGASADAQTAYDDGAFADSFPITAGTYSDAEAARGIVSFAPGNSEAAYRSHAPYMYGVPLGPVAEIQGAGVGAVGCQRMAGQKAVFAGDPTYQASTRRFAVLEPTQPEYAGGAAVLKQEMSSCGATVVSYTYSADVSQEANEAAQITTEMKADNDTTVLMLTDPFMSEFMTDSAQQEQYNPEWVFTVFSQTMARNANASEMAHSIDISPWHATNGAPSQRLCAQIYARASSGGTAQSGPLGVDAECSVLMAIFAALQNAGPNLTAQNFGAGWFNLPDSVGSSDFGHWSFAANQWSPDASFSVLQWTASGTSPYDGGTGGWVPCAGPADYPYQGAGLGSGQLPCYGQ
jgi:hypothetical protein